MMRFFQVLFVTTVLLSGSALVQAREDSELSQGSVLSGMGVSMVVAGSVEVIATSPQLIVQAINTGAEVASVVLEGSAEAATVSITVTPEIAGYLSQAVGTTVEVITEASGYALMHAGRMIAFVPNEIGRRLLHHAPH